MRQALTRLQAAAEASALASLCQRYDVSLLVVFGSVLDAAVPEPRDLDVAVRFAAYDPAKVLPLLDEVARLAGIGDVDLMVLNTAGPVAREQALVFGEALYEAFEGLHARAQIAASMERMDTDHLRRNQLELLRTHV